MLQKSGFDMKLFLFRIFILAILSFYVGPAIAAGEDGYYSRQTLNGEWDFRKISGVFTYTQGIDEADGQWIKLSVPSNWYLNGIDHHGSAVYRKMLSIKEIKSEQRAFLKFDGVDYAADIWVNGKFVGSHQGYFQQFGFEITEQLKEGDNIIHVAVHSPNEEMGTIWSLRKQLIKGIFNHHDTRPGGAWSVRGQEKNTGGIWAPVDIVFTGPSVFDSFKITPKADEKKQGTVSVSFNLSRAYGRSVNRVVFRLTPKNFQGESKIIEYKLNGTGKTKFEYSLNHGSIKKWWPYELGAPNLYEIEATLFSRHGVSDVKREAFGYREIRRDTNTGEWFINGRRYFLRGTNYIPTQWLSEMASEDYDRDLGLMRGANINIVRVHAHIGAKDFYTAADLTGMLVWQDFPLQWGYEDSKGFLSEARSQALDMVVQFGNHPSIITWSMQNEPPWDADWMKYKYDDYDPEQNRILTNDLYEIILAADKTRYVHSHSATSEHPWLGWYSGSWKDYGKPTKENLITEYGAQALPSIDSLRRIFSEEALWPDNEEDWKLWAYHNFQKHELTNVAGVKIGDNISEFIENTQQYQSKLTKFAAESLRRQKYQPVGGIFQFMFNEDWPSVNWGIVDYWRNQKPAYNSLKSAYQPILASLEWEREEYETGQQVEIAIWLINDLYKDYKNANYELSLTTPEGVLPAGQYFLDIQPDSIEKVALWTRTFQKAGAYTLSARVISDTGEVLSVNSFSFSVNGVKN